MKDLEVDATLVPLVAYLTFTCHVHCSACDVREETIVTVPTTLRGSKQTSNRRNRKWRFWSMI